MVVQGTGLFSNLKFMECHILPTQRRDKHIHLRLFHNRASTHMPRLPLIYQCCIKAAVEFDDERYHLHHCDIATCAHARAGAELRG